MKAKRILANATIIIISAATIIIISACVFLTGYTSSLELPVYADSVTDGWTQVTTNEQLVEAFRYYCKSRDLTIEGSIADGVTSFTTKTFNGICNTLGIDITALQAEIKYSVDSSNLRYRYLFSAFGIDVYNRIFAQFLQDNDLEVGDEVDETVYSGEYFVDNAHNGCLVYYTDAVGSARPRLYGTPYKMDSNSLATYYRNNNTVFEFNTDNPDNQRLRTLATKTDYLNVTWLVDAGMINNSVASVSYGLYDLTNNSPRGNYIIMRFGGVLYAGIDNGQILVNLFQIQMGEDSSVENVNIYITTNNTTINNNTYEGDTIINNNGTTGDDDDNPSGGGGGNTITPPGTIGGGGSDGTINFPDFNFNLPEINWSLGDLSQKFPFCIPFDMIAFLTLLNGEPQAPHITGTIPLTSHYTWNLDLDFSQFDTFASIMRGLEFVGFMFFLISATINIVRG